jgi:hypothetical protein
MSTLTFKNGPYKLIASRFYCLLPVSVNQGQVVTVLPANLLRDDEPQCRGDETVGCKIKILVMHHPIRLDA